MKTFLWTGKLERLQLDEVKNPPFAGGLDLPCVFSKANALFLKQTCRWLMDSTTKQYGHLKYWIGIHLKEFFPDMAFGPHAELVCPYFQHVRMLLVEGFVLGDIKLENLRSVTAKELYQKNTSSFPPPKVEFKFDVDWDLVWARLQYLNLEPLPREYLFSIIHNIVPNRERLNIKMNLADSPNCLSCGVREDNTHLFTECCMVREAWGWVRLRLLALLPDSCSITSNFEFINLMFDKHFMDKEAVWIIGTFVEQVWIEKIKKKRKVKIEQIKGILKVKYQANQVSRRPFLNYIENISK